jgi:hypothetical protein
MPSPFPGMDPYLESPAHWSDFHATFIQEVREAINKRLPENYVARVGEYVSLVNTVAEIPRGTTYYPDVTVTRRDAGGGGGAVSTAVMPPPATTLTNIESLDPHTETYIQIVRLPEQDPVTVLELLSPTNKYGEGRGDYVRKRLGLRRQLVNLVELDLLRAGPRLEFAQALPAGHYYAFVTRGARAEVTDAYPWTVRSVMPVIPIPLRPPDADVAVSLAEPFASAYERGQYRKLIDYTKPPPPPAFGPRDAEWVAQTAVAGVKPSNPS